MYSYNPKIYINIEDNIIEGRLVTIYKRAKVIVGRLAHGIVSRENRHTIPRDRDTIPWYGMV
jgi:hypothetical protein